MAFKDNYFALQPLIIERLRQEVPELMFVAGSQSRKEVAEGVVPLPAALVIFGGDTVQPTKSGGRGAIQMVTLTFVIEIVVPSDWCAVSGEGSLMDGGHLYRQIIDALAGWKPSEEFDELYRTQASRPVYEETEDYYQLAFSTESATQ